MTTVISPVKIKERAALDVRAGDTVRVHQKIQEKGKTRIQIFEGIVLAVKHGKEAGATFTVRRTASGVGVEKIFPFYSPMIEKVEIVKRSKVRRAKLYHIRDKAAKVIRRQMRNTRDIPEEIEIDDEVEMDDVAVEEPEETLETDMSTDTATEEASAESEDTKEKEA